MRKMDTCTIVQVMKGGLIVKEYFLRMAIGADGRVEEIGTYSRDEMIRELMRPRRMRGGAFAVMPDDLGDTRLLKLGVAAVGGIRQLSYDLNVSRETLYNWKKRDHVPAEYREVIRGLIERSGLECED